MTQQVALVTGSSRGIGLGIALALADKGFAVAVSDMADSETLQSALEQVQAMGVKACKVVLNVTDLGAYDKALDEIEAQLGPITTLVNNAGVSVMNRADMLDVSEESYDRCMNVNTKGAFFLTQAYAKRVIAAEKQADTFYSIVNITSSNAKAVATPRSEYCVSKAAAAMSSQCWAVRLGPEGVHVYDVQPGFISTEMTAPVIDQYEQRAKDGLTLLPRVGYPEDMGGVVASLASGALPYVTGHVISADGGLLVPRY